MQGSIRDKSTNFWKILEHSNRLDDMHFSKKRGSHSFVVRENNQDKLITYNWYEPREGIVKRKYGNV
jgi:hypothetical protein